MANWVEKESETTMRFQKAIYYFNHSELRRDEKWNYTAF